MADEVNVPNFQQYDYNIGDTVEVVTKQNALNLAMRQFGVSLNQTVYSINDDVDEIRDARDNLDADKIVHAPGSGLPNEAGEAYSRDVVGGEGFLMAQGAFGLGLTGAAQRVEDLTEDISSGMYRVRGDATGAPAGMNDNFWGTVIAQKGNEGRRTFSLTVPTGSSTLVFEGSRTEPTGPIAWSTLYSQKNILGSVFFAGGDPAGAVIETGSNDNGDYTKLANGLMVCQRAVEVDGTSPGRQQWSLPAGGLGVGANYISFGLSDALTHINAYRNVTPMISANNFSIGVGSGSESMGESRSCLMTWVGRWY